MKPSQFFSFSKAKFHLPRKYRSTLFSFVLLLVSENSFSESILVANTNELKTAVSRANYRITPEPIFIILKSGNYVDASNITLSSPHITIRSLDGNAQAVTLSGKGMTESEKVEVIFDIQADNITISGLTLKNVSHHLVQVRAEKAVNFFTLENCILQDSYQQLLKVSGDESDNFSDFGTIKNNRFEYTEGIGPNFYIGGIDAHKSRGWTVQKNTFVNIASPAKKAAEHAIHFWRRSSDNAIINNTIINSDRGIGFGLGNNRNQSKGGVIAFNRITHDNPNHVFADVGISLESSPQAIVKNNKIHLNSNYPNAIEYRFPATKDVIIKGNVTNKAIVARDGADAILLANTTADNFQQYWNSALYHFKQIFRYINE